MRILRSHVREREVAASALLEVARELGGEYDLVASIATGGIFWGTVLADRLGVPHVYVRTDQKEYGAGGRVAGDFAALENARALVVEDTSSAFKSALAAIGALEEVGAMVNHTLAIATWRFSEFYKNVGNNHRVHLLVAGGHIIKYSGEKGLSTRFTPLCFTRGLRIRASTGRGKKHDEPPLRSRVFLLTAS